MAEAGDLGMGGDVAHRVVLGGVHALVGAARRRVVGDVGHLVLDGVEGPVEEPPSVLEGADRLGRAESKEELLKALLPWFLHMAVR